MDSDMLPGLGPEYLPDRAGAADMRNEKVYTAAVLMRSYPKIYESVVVGLEYGIPVSAIADLLHLSRRTVAVIRDAQTARPFFVGERQKRLRGMVTLKALEELNERLSSDDIKSLTVGELLKLADQPVAQGSADMPSKKDAPIDVESFAMYDDMINGFGAGENSAREVEGDGDGERPTDGPTDGVISETEQHGGENANK